MTSPFDSAKYNALLEGLEISIVPLSKLERTARLDAEFYLKRYIDTERYLSLIEKEPLTKHVNISDGNHFTISDQFINEGVPYYRGQDAVSHFFIEQSEPVRISLETYNQPHMLRSHLKKGDVLLSIVGTIGEPSLVSEDYPATCSCKLAILRPTKRNSEYLAVYLSSKYGLSQIQRLTRGAVQQGLILEDMDQIQVVQFSRPFEKSIENLVSSSRLFIAQYQAQNDAAKKTFHQAVGLTDWKPPQPLSYKRLSSEVFMAGRLDAGHFEERYYATKDALIRAGAIKFISINDISTKLTNGHTPLRHDLAVGDVAFLCAEHISDFYVNYNSNKRILKSHHQGELARTSIKNGDILITIKGKVGNFALAENVPNKVNINQDVALLRLDSSVPVWYFLSFYNSKIGKLFVDQQCSGAINPFLALYNIKKLPIPLFSRQLMERIATTTRERIIAASRAYEKYQNAIGLAKRAIEIAIERSEDVAINFLNKEIE